MIILFEHIHFGNMRGLDEERMGQLIYMKPSMTLQLIRDDPHKGKLTLPCVHPLLFNIGLSVRTHIVISTSVYLQQNYSRHQTRDASSQTNPINLRNCTIFQ